MKPGYPLKTSLALLIACAMLLTTAGPTFADEGSGGDKPQPANDYIGSVTSTLQSDPLPAGKTGFEVPGTNRTNPTPGGGYAYANAMLAWAPLRMDGTAQTGVEGTTLVFALMAQVVQVSKNGVPKGGAGPNWGYGSGGAQVSATKSVYEWVFGSQWRLDTCHVVTGNNFDWRPCNTIYANP